MNIPDPWLWFAFGMGVISTVLARVQRPARRVRVRRATHRALLPRHRRYPPDRYRL